MRKFLRNLEFINRYRGLALFLLAVCLIGGQVATMKVLVEDSEQGLADSFRFDILGSMDPEFIQIDPDAIDELDKDKRETKKASTKAVESEVGTIASKQTNKNDGDRHKQVHPLEGLIADLSSSNPLRAKCFGTAAYVPRSDSADQLNKIQGSVVRKLIDDGDLPENLFTPESIVARIWLARDRALNAEGRKTHLSALGNYLIAAQRTLKDAHQYYGGDGLEWAQGLLKTRADKRVQQQIRLRVPSDRYTRKLNLKMQLLLDHPDDFIPCTVRAEKDFGS